ncbi:MAG TPA: GAF domain-containing sensor histidine kinase [Candidatus Tripitaka californicus]|uniref:GAF domain-containing sensor histidine kinase n=1 Tax=Candidatus Tripitaka californicus TaxID=3367616 RepID=UPI0040251C26
MKLVELYPARKEVISNIQRIISSSLNLKDIYASVVNELKKVMAFDRVSISIPIEGDNQAITFVASVTSTINVLEEGKPYPLKGSLLERILLTGEPIIVEDTKSGSHSTNGLFYKAGIRSRLGYPLKVRGRVIGSINFSSMEPNHFSTTQFPLLEEICPQLAMLTENTLLFEKVTLSEERYKNLYNNARLAEEQLRQEKEKLDYVVDVLGIGLCLMDRGMNILWANANLPKVWGLTELPKGARCRDVFQCTEAYCPVARALESAEGRYREIKTLVRDGRRRYIENTAIPLQDEKGEMGRVLVLSRDITQREKRLRQLSLLRELGQALHKTLNIEKLLNLILTSVTAGQALAFNRAFLFLVDEEKGSVYGKAAVGPSSGEEAARIWQDVSHRYPTLEELLKEVMEREPLDSPLNVKTRLLVYPLNKEEEIVVRCVKEMRSQVVKEAATDPRVTREFREFLGSKEFVCVPLVVKGGAVGVIIADNPYSMEPITDDHVHLLNIFAGQAALAMENAETYKSLEEKIEQLRETQERLCRSERLVAMGEISTYIAHEIRNPLVTIGGFARSIEKTKPEEEDVATAARIIVEEVSRLEKILGNIKDFSKPQEPRKVRVDINTLLEDTCCLTEGYLRERGINLIKNFSPGLPPTFLDPAQIKQVLLNLVKNAVESMEEGGTLTVQSIREEQYIRTDISDTGQGMAPEVMEKIFTPFFTTKTSGTGVGLVVSHKIVDDHDGKLRVSSVQGRGSTFSMLLPITE